MSKRLMRQLSFLFLFILILGGCEFEQEADTVLMNGKVYTVEGQKKWAQAVAIDGEEIVYVGKNKKILDFIGENTEVIDLEGKMVLPAFVDTHMHPALSSVVYLFQVSLHSLFSHADYLAAIQEFVDSHPDAAAIEGAGFLRSLYDEVGPRKDDLDAIEATRPIRIISVDGHSAWVNSKALELAGITADTPDPTGGVIKRIPGSGGQYGEPAGLLQESAAGLVAHLFPPPTKEQYKAGLLWLQEWFNSVGITTAHDAMVSVDDPDYYMAYEELAREGLLTVRYRGSWHLDPEMAGAYGSGGGTGGYMAAIDEGLSNSAEFQTPHWQVHSFKFFADQVIEEETGYLIEPYAHRPDWYGIKVWEDDQLKEAYQKVDAAGFQIHTHQIGDAAARYALDALEYVRDLNGARDSRHSFAHIQMMRPDDIQRMANLGMNAITAPYWQVVDDYYWDLYLPYLGPIRADNEQYPMRSLFKAGLNVTIHSDFFVTPPDFAWAFYSAMTRVLPERIADEWYGPGNYYRTTDPNEVLNYYDLGVLGPAKERAKLPQVIRAATINGAKANFLEKEIGSVEIGKLADLVVLDRNLFKVDVEEIANFEVLMTFFEGDLVYSAN